MGLDAKDSSKKIRAKAEARLEKIAGPQKQKVWDTDKLIHELSVHQVELEIQNAELRRAQEELEESQRKYTDLYNFAPVGYFILDDKGHIVEVNLTGTALTGIERSSLLKKLFTLCIRREDRDIFYLNYRQAIKTGLCQQCELKLLREKNGGELSVELTIDPIIDTAGKVTQCRIVVTDITERKKAEEIIRNSEIRFRELFEHMSSAVAVYEPENGGEDFIFKDCNQALSNIEKVDKNQIIGRRVTEVFPGVKEFGLFDVLKRVYHTGKAEHFPVSLYKDQRISGWKENYVYKLLSGEVIAIYDDITDRKKAEEKLKEALGIKEVLLRELHHRVKNNMQVISSLLRLQSRTIDDRNTAEIFRECQDRIQAMALIHERFYHSEDLSSIDFETYIKELTQGLIQSYNISPDRITMSINIKDVPLEINEAISCGLIINELVSNSLKYAFPQDKKGQIDISMTPTGKDEIELIISDNGVGIPAELDHQKTETLGLQLVNTFVKDQLDSNIDLDRNAGTKFRIKIKKKSVK